MARKINLTDELKKCFGFNKFKGNQEAIINNLLDGKDTFVLMPTGGGKSFMLSATFGLDGRYGNRNFSAHCVDEESSGCNAQFQ